MYMFDLQLGCSHDIEGKVDAKLPVSIHGMGNLEGVGGV